ncbi:tRNA-specific 2-thiouridylase MnmA [Brevinematales bacterium NS]|nr:tRNA 2-thiouridine(34) synthase MnmA [Brevinematales bacterium]QJR21942.1 tRNA-specific 2-thiouridylase MnmA [Brevinematales bacterium NS]
MTRVFVGMSGGVDSSAAAYLLKEAGYQVEGVTFVAAFESGTKKCCSLEEIEAAKRVCQFLGISHHVIDLKDVFEARVIRYFLEGYQQALVPNPCVMCNRYIKFGALVEEAISRGADMVATGHYARVFRDEKEVGLYRGKDITKDQSYFLAYVPKEMFSYVIFPLGDKTKAEVREIVARSGMPISSSKGESQDVCFVPGDYREYLLSHGVSLKKGDFLYEGKPVGKHRGLALYSLGQRRGLGVSIGKRLYIRSMDVESGNIVLGDVPKSRQVWLRDVNLLTSSFREGTYEVQIRYQSEFVACEVKWEGECLHLLLERPAEIVTPGQLGVLFLGDRVIASGIIDRTILEE